MIRISKSEQPPIMLLTVGTSERDRLCASYDADPESYSSGRKRHEFKQIIYGDPSVKAALVDAQHKKCCFCESKVGDDGDIEHFRPKAASRQSKGGRLIRPGYYWLAYNWDNLLLCCGPCNQRHKRNLFPLSNPDYRARTHHEAIELELPMFINPASVEPEEHIMFRREIPFAATGSSSGKCTIDALQLDREILNERRRDRLDLLMSIFDLIVMLRNQSNISDHIVMRLRLYERLLEEAVQDDSEYASMARSAARANWYLNED